MAQPIYCDGEGCEQPADVLVSQLANGDTLALCNPHWAGFLVASAQGLEDQAPPPAPPAEPEPDPRDRPDADDEDADDTEALRRLEAVSAPRTADTAPDGSEAAQGASAPPGPAEGAVEPTTVVARGTSRSRRKYEARERAKQKAAQVEAEAAD